MRSFLLRLAVAVLAALMATTVLAGSASAARDAAQIWRWTSTDQLKKGTVSAATVTRDQVEMKAGTTSSTWTSPWQSTGFRAHTLIPSWSISTTNGSWAVVEARVRSGSTIGSWDTVATWAMYTDRVKRSSGSSQTDDLAKLSTDTIYANSSSGFDGFQLRVTLRRASANGSAPVLGAAQAVAANYGKRAPGTSATTMTRDIDLAVPRSSQMVHRNHLTQYDGGGAAWCSPTSASMVMRYFGTAPPASAYAWTKDSRGYVDHAAHYSYDYAYRGTGNWAFTVAYANRYGADAFVTRLYSLREAESFIKAGIPLVASVAFAKGGLTGAPLSSTPGHLMVIRGFTKSGRVIANDPSAASDDSVRRTYDRAQFERAWQMGSGGVVYVIRPRSRALPPHQNRW